MENQTKQMTLEQIAAILDFFADDRYAAETDLLLRMYLAENAEILDVQRIPPAGIMAAFIRHPDSSREVAQSIIAPGIWREPDEHVLASTIMGADFTHAKDMISLFLGKRRAACVAGFQKIPYDEATLRACAGTHRLFPDPGLSLRVMCRLFMNNRDINPAVISGDPHLPDAPWATESAQPTWRLLRKEPALRDDDGIYPQHSRWATRIAPHYTAATPREAAIAHLLTPRGEDQNPTAEHKYVQRTHYTDELGCEWFLRFGKMLEINRLHARRLKEVTGQSEHTFVVRKPTIT